MRRTLVGPLVASTVAVAMVMAAGGQALAEDPTTAEVESTVEAIDEATEVADEVNGVSVVTSVPDGDAAAVAETTAGTVTMPETLDGTVAIGEGAAAVEIGLPDLGGQEGVLDESGETVVYADPEAPVDLAVQATESGARALITMKDESAPNRYTFDVTGPAGSRLVPAGEVLGAEYETGEVLLVAEDGALLGTFDAPWATDATGAPVDTWYELTDGQLSQVVAVDADTVYPVVADPNWWSIAKCTAAIVAFVGMNLVSVSKLLKIKKYIAALGGFRESAMLMLRASNWEERLRIGGGALVGLAGEILGYAVIRNNC